MKRSKLVLAITTIILSVVSIAATKPINIFSAAYIHDGTGACITVSSPCVQAPGVLCTTISEEGILRFGVSVYVDQGNCLVKFTRSGQ